YILTVADVRATNPKLWNSWKAHLFQELYESTKRALRRGLERPIDKEELIKETKEAALALLGDRNATVERMQDFWRPFTEDYFLQHTPHEIAWHAEGLLSRIDGAGPLVDVRQRSDRGVTSIFVYSRANESTFAQTTAALDQLGLNIWDARVVCLKNGFNLQTYYVLEDTGDSITDDARLLQIQNITQREVNKQDAPPMEVTRHIPRQVKMFTTPTQIYFENDSRNNRTVVEITTGDRPGLLSAIGQAFRVCKIQLQNAKITTVGERAEDVFFINNSRGQPLETETECSKLEKTLRNEIEKNI
ncbi:MAG: [protein-PII] uridylyltransferase, partial [Gammaproteobacteria bacterium]|nr:[protein-PII] uridylyltransferase [Gammaproteobacteria bacterium]